MKREDLTHPAVILQKLIQCPSVTPKEGGALGVIEKLSHELGFKVERPVFSDENTPDIENLYARFGESGPHLMFAGHSDVVPTGDEKQWQYPPFSGTIDNGVLYGRGAVDMKGGIACFLAAVARVFAAKPFKGSLSLLITGDEEGPAINGTIKLLEWAKKRGEIWDAALVGEPTNVHKLGDMIKIGRRGSLSGILTVKGQQGHVAYPDRAANPLPDVLNFAAALLSPPLDDGSKHFQPSNLELTSIDTANLATNVIPGQTSVRFNIRYNDLWSVESLKKEIERRLMAVGGKKTSYDLQWLISPGGVFLTQKGLVVETLQKAITTVTGEKAELSTSGGTSDARFIKDYCPVVEFGLVGRSMHMVDEHVSLSDLENLTKIYEHFIEDFFAFAKG